MSYRRTIASGIACVTCAWLLAACGGGEEVKASGAGGEKITLDYATFKNPGALQCAADAEEFARLVDEKTGGTVEIKIHYSDSLVPQAELVDALATGTVDAGCVFAAFYPAQLSLWNELGTVDDMDLSLSVDPVDQNAIARKAMEEFPELTGQVEDLGAQFVYQAVSAPSGLMTKFELGHVSDLDGQKIRTYGTGIPAMLKDVGALPVDIPWVETYTALQNGTVDGAYSVLNAFEEASIDETAPHLTLFGDEGISSMPIMAPGMLTVIGRSAWDKLNDSQREAILEAGKEAEAWLAEEQIARAEASIKKMEDRSGITVTRLTRDELEPLRAAAASGYDRAATALDEDGLSGTEFVARIREIAAEVVKGEG
ncbi:MAG: luxR1 [Blastococcus sp.]|jgi:TRAP-type C4-dicarboxylate transport system substrate-binding protein|nr:luxR1 [Blastococcus sp.]